MVDKPILAWPPLAGMEDPVRGAPLPWGAAAGIVPLPTTSPPIQVPKPSSCAESPLTQRVAAELQALLARAVREEVVPRLVLTQRPSLGEHCPPREHDPCVVPEDVVALVALVVSSDAPTAVAFVESLRARGAPLDRLYLELLAPAARRLGQLWVEDLCSFADVTIALARLQHVVRELSPAFVADTRAPDLRRRAALLAMPGEQHTFGLTMVSEFFVRAGWEVWSEPTATMADLTALVGREWFAIIGFSVACDSGITGLAGVIRSVRRASCNPAIGVMVGGRAFTEHPELAPLVGADATALDGRQAALQAETLLALLHSASGR